MRFRALALIIFLLLAGLAHSADTRLTGGVDLPGLGTTSVIRNSSAGISTGVAQTPLPVVSVNPVSDFILCNNSELPPIRFSGSADTRFDWQVINSTGNVSVGSALGLPGWGTNEIAGYRLVNRTQLHITETIRVIPRLTDSNGHTYNGDAISFTVTVLPTPAIDPIANVLAQSGEPVPAIPFTGAATSCRWYSSNPNVNADLHAPFHGEGLSFPGFTTANITDEIIRSVVTVTPVYSYRSGVNAFVCEGEPVEFFIIAGPVPFIEPIENIRIGEYGTTGEFVPLRLPSGSGYHLEWTVSDSRIGLESHIYTPGDTERKTIPGLKATIFPNELNEPSVATVTVTPLLTAGNTTFRGDSVQFTITVVPQTRLRPGFGEEVETEQNCCIGDPVELKVEATGYALKYQWYRNHLPIPGADKAVFTIDRAAVEHDGDYYATVTGENGSLKSKTWKVTVKPNVVSQRWDDVLVLNTNPADNGGYGFSGYQWYEITPEGTVKLPGETLSYLYVAGGPVSSRQYYVEAVTGNGQNFQSCPVSLQPLQPQAEIRVYPNPVRAGGYVTVEIHAAGNDATIMLLDITSKIVSQTKAAGDITHIKIPGSGIYILEVILTDTVKSFKIIVL